MFFNEISYSIRWPGREPLGAVRLSYGCQVFENENRFLAADDREFLGFYVNLGKDFDFNFSQGSAGTLHKGQYILIYLPSANCEYGIRKGKVSEFGCHFTREFLRTLTDQFPFLEEFLKNVERKQPSTLSVTPLQVTDEMQKVIRRILYHNSRWDEVRNVYFLSRVFDILTLCLQQISLIKEVHQPYDLAVQKVHRRLLSHLQDHYDLNLVADQAGMDLRTLTRVFTRMYGKTVSKFLFEERMKKAVALLRDSNMTLAEIMHATGYREHTSFSRAFKRKFGHPPIHFRQSDRKKD